MNRKGTFLIRKGKEFGSNLLFQIQQKQCDDKKGAKKKVG